MTGVQTCALPISLVRDVRVLAVSGGSVRLRMVLALGHDGSLRPDEVLLVLGYNPAPEALRVHRAALHQSIWRTPTRGVDFQRRSW